jgi:hypothetical protein
MIYIDMSNNIYIYIYTQNLTGDEQAPCKVQGSKHKKTKKEASLDLKPHVALWKRLANITIDI